MCSGKCWLLCSVLLVAGCASDDRSGRPTVLPPAPPQDVINTVGFDDAMHVGSDYVYASKLPDRVFIGSQELPGNLWLLRFDGPSGGKPVDLVIDTKTGKVVKEVPAGAEAELKSTLPPQPAAASKPSVVTDQPKVPYPMPSDAPSLQE